MTERLPASSRTRPATTRTVNREELLTYISLIAGAGDETTTGLIGWIAKVLGDHPDQRREIAEDRSLIPNAIDEILRTSRRPSFGAQRRRTTSSFHGQTVAAGRRLCCSRGAANRDERRFAEADRFDIHRRIEQHLTFGYGAHFCLGAALARLEGRIALDEVLKAHARVAGRLDAPNAPIPAPCGAWRNCPSPRRDDVRKRRRDRRLAGSRSRDGGPPPSPRLARRRGRALARRGARATSGRHRCRSGR